MGLDSRLAQVIALTIILGTIMGFLWLTGAWSQDRLRNQPIVSDQVVEKTDELRIVGKDEAQRISDETILRIQKLENEVSELRREFEKLKAQVEGG